MRPLAVEQDDRRIEVRPAEEFGVDVSPALFEFGATGCTRTLNPASFKPDIAPARSFARFKRARRS